MPHALATDVQAGQRGSLSPLLPGTSLAHTCGKPYLHPASFKGASTTVGLLKVTAATVAKGKLRLHPLTQPS